MKKFIHRFCNLGILFIFTCIVQIPLSTSQAQSNEEILKKLESIERRFESLGHRLDAIGKVYVQPHIAAMKRGANLQVIYACTLVSSVLLGYNVDKSLSGCVGNSPIPTC